MLIGLLRNYKTPASRDRVAALNIKEFGHQAIFFSITDVDFENKLIFGKKLVNGKWVEDQSEFPDVVYNDLPPARLADPKLYKRLEDEGIPFTTHRLGLNKSKFTEIMQKNLKLHKYMIETRTVSTTKEFTDFLVKHQSIVMKPNRGHKGLGIFVYELEENSEFVIEENYDGKKLRIALEDLDNHFRTANFEAHHLQKKVIGYTKNKVPFIIRSYVGKTGKGRWLNIFNYAAVSTNGNSVINVSRGSGVSFMKEFCEDNYGDQADIYMKRVQDSCIEVAKAVQNEFDFEIDALGLDYCLKENGELFLYEVNAFPGSRPHDALVEFHAVQFAMYLYHKNKNLLPS